MSRPFGVTKNCLSRATRRASRAPSVKAINGRARTISNVQNAFCQPEIPDAPNIVDRPQEREGSAFAVHGVLTRGEGDVPAAAGWAFPDAEACCGGSFTT